MSRRSRLLWIAGGVGLVLLLVIVLGCGSISQFSPVTFEHRGVTTFVIPYTDVRIFSIPGKPCRSRIVQFWIDEGYLKPEPGPTDRWDLICGSASAPGWRSRAMGEAKGFWYTAGCTSDEGAEEWIAWSRRHPDLAKDLWPRVVGYLQTAADVSHRGEGYFVAGALMDYIRQAEDARTYQDRVGKWRQDCAKEIATVE